MAASVYCSGKLLRTFARNSQSRGVNTCKFLSLSGFLLFCFFNHFTILGRRNCFRLIRTFHLDFPWLRSKSNESFNSRDRDRWEYIFFYFLWLSLILRRQFSHSFISLVFEDDLKSHAFQTSWEFFRLTKSKVREFYGIIIYAHFLRISIVS